MHDVIRTPANQNGFFFIRTAVNHNAFFFLFYIRDFDALIIFLSLLSTLEK